MLLYRKVIPGQFLYFLLHIFHQILAVGDQPLLLIFYILQLVRHLKFQ